LSRTARPLKLVYWFFFLSGIAGLVYEVVWARLLERVMGATVYSITTVLTVYMAGLALGSYLAGKMIDRRDDPLRVFGFLEGAIGVYCLLVPAIVAATIPIYRAAYQSFDATFHTFSLVRFLISGLVLIIPTTLMGATLPVLSRYFTTRYDSLAQTVGGLYAVNTFGAVVGSFIAGFLLMPLLGIMGTIVVAAAINIVVAGVVLVLHARGSRAGAREKGAKVSGAGKKKHRDRAKRGGGKRSKNRAADDKARAAAEGAKRKATPADRGKRVPADRVLAFVLVAFALSGFAAMVYQIAWMRTLSLVIGSSVYAVSLTLTAYILGLALGAALFSRFIDRTKDLLATMSGLEIGIGAAALIVVPILGRLPLMMIGVIRNYGGSFGALMAAEFFIVFLVVLVPTVLMGAVFPTVIKLFTKRVETVGRSVGDAYAANTVGAIVGSFAGGFLLIPSLGIQGAISVAVVVNIAVGIALVFLSPVARKTMKLAVAAIGIVVLTIFLTLVPDWDPVIMASGGYLYADMYAEQAQSWDMSREDAVRLFGKILYHKEGVATTVTVRQARSDLYLQSNGKTEASTGPDMRTQKLLAHAPMLLHPDPKNVLVIGLASGVTSGAALRHPIEKIDSVEIAPAMIEVAGTFFAEANQNCLADPRHRVIVEDGRNHVAFTDEKYDVIISQPSNPWIVGISNLFTKEFFELARDRMNPGGVVGFWFQAYNMTPDEFRMIVHTFHEVFESASIWELDPGADYMLIGAVGEMSLDWGRLTERLADPEIGGDLESIGVTSPFDYTGFFVMNRTTIPAYVGDAPIHTDNGLELEFSAPKSMYLTSKTEQLAALSEHRRPPTGILTGLPEGEARDEIIEAVRSRAVARKLLADGLVAEGEGRSQEALEAYSMANEASPDEREIDEALSRLLCGVAGGHVRNQEYETALPYYLAAVDAGPSFPQPRCLLGSAYVRLGRLDEAEAELVAALELDPDYADAHLNLSFVYERRGMVVEQVQALERYLENAPTASNVEQVRSQVARLRSQLERAGR